MTSTMSKKQGSRKEAAEEEEQQKLKLLYRHEFSKSLTLGLREPCR